MYQVRSGHARLQDELRSTMVYTTALVPRVNILRRLEGTNWGSYPLAMTMLHKALFIVLRTASDREPSTTSSPSATYRVAFFHDTQYCSCSWPEIAQAKTVTSHHSDTENVHCQLTIVRIHDKSSTLVTVVKLFVLEHLERKELMTNILRIH